MRRRQQLTAAGELDDRLAEAAPQQPAVALGEDRLRDLVAAALRVVELIGERVQPRVDAVLHVPDGPREEPRPGREQAEPDDRVGRAVRRHVDEREEAAEEHERRAEVPDEDQEHHRGAPHHEQRPEVLERRQRDPEDLVRALDEHLARVAQVGREEDDDRDLRQLGGLEGDRADADAEVRAVDLLADPRDAREQQEQDARGRDDVAIALEHPHVLAQRDDRAREDDEPHDEPLRLLAGEVLVEPVEHHEPEARERRDEREEVRVGVRERHAHDEVRDEAQAEEQPAVGQRRVREDVVALHEHRREARCDQQGGGDEGEELAIALGHRAVRRPCSSSRTRSAASSCERSWWSSSVARRAAGTSFTGTPEM